MFDVFVHIMYVLFLDLDLVNWHLPLASFQPVLCKPSRDYAGGFAESCAEGFAEYFTAGPAEGFAERFAKSFADGFVCPAVRFHRHAIEYPKSMPQFIGQSYTVGPVEY